MPHPQKYPHEPEHAYRDQDQRWPHFRSRAAGIRAVSVIHYDGGAVREVQLLSEPLRRRARDNIVEAVMKIDERPIAD